MKASLYGAPPTERGLWRNFNRWLCYQTERLDPVGDFARDWRDDPETPILLSFHALEEHLEDMGASANAVAAYARAVREWKSGFTRESTSSGALP